MIKVTVINGSPRKKWNTATMLKNFIEGASSTGKDIKTNFFHLYDYKSQGCISCFACHRKGSTYGKCIVRDDITDLLEMVSHADIVVFGSPIYFHEITAQLRGFLERLIYQYLSFDAEHEGNLAPKSLQTAFIYTMNVTKDIMEKGNYPVILNEIERYVWNVFGQQPERLCAYNTYQYTDYNKYVATYWDENEKSEYRRTQFPLDCKAAFDLGVTMIQRIAKIE